MNFPHRTPATLITLAIAAFLAVPSIPWAQQPESPELAAARGDYAASVKVLKRDGSLASGEKYRLQLNISGPDPDIVTGIIPDDGIIHLEGLAGGDGGPSYLLLVGKRDLEAERFELKGPERHRTLEFMVAPAPGDPAPDITFQVLHSQEKKKLSDYRGQVVWLDFWASWCRPCHKPMSKVEEVMRRHKEDWKGKAAVVALSIDYTPKEAQEFVRERKLHSLDHYWSSEGEPGFFSDPQRAYRIDSIPTSFLIGTDGVILWRGHPSNCDVEKLISDALD